MPETPLLDISAHRAKGQLAQKSRRQPPSRKLREALGDSPCRERVGLRYPPLTLPTRPHRPGLCAFVHQSLCSQNLVILYTPPLCQENDGELPHCRGGCWLQLLEAAILSPQANEKEEACETEAPQQGGQASSPSVVPVLRVADQQGAPALGSQSGIKAQPSSMSSNMVQPAQRRGSTESSESPSTASPVDTSSPSKSLEFQSSGKKSDSKGKVKETKGRAHCYGNG